MATTARSSFWLPTDNWRPAVARFRKAQPSVPIHAIGCGEDVDFSVLKEITTNTYFMREMDAGAFGRLFACVSASVRSVTNSALNGGAPQDDLEAWAGGALRKPTADECRPQKEIRQVFLPLVCSTTKKDYLLRFRLDDSERYYCAAAHKLDKPMPGAEGSAQTINTSRLGAPLDCPYCGNPGVVKCSCGTLSCNSMTKRGFQCPQCGHVGMLGVFVAILVVLAIGGCFCPKQVLRQREQPLPASGRVFENHARSGRTELTVSAPYDSHCFLKLVDPGNGSTVFSWPDCTCGVTRPGRGFGALRALCCSSSFITC
ncbi:MAG: hypothetical protein IJ783_06850 [Kiritimatiellae bacterium]|nr:hypothetical protein [Kiritimatiellia bacterium]